MSVAALFFWLFSSSGEVSGWNSGALRACAIAAPPSIFFMGYNIISLTEGRPTNLPGLEWFSIFLGAVFGIVFGAIHYFVGLGDTWSGFVVTFMLHLFIGIPFLALNNRVGRMDNDSHDEDQRLMLGEISIIVGCARYLCICASSCLLVCAPLGCCYVSCCVDADGLCTSLCTLCSLWCLRLNCRGSST